MALHYGSRFQPGNKNSISSESSVFGSEYKITSIDIPFSTTSDSFQKSYSIVTDNLSGGIYKISWDYVWSSNNINEGVEIKILLNNTIELLYPHTIMYPINCYHKENSIGETMEKYRENSFITQTLSGINTIDFYIRNTINGYNFTIYKIIVEIYKIKNL